MSVAITCIVAAAGLAVTYSITAPRIAEQEKAAERAALKEVIPEAASFEAAGPEMLAEAQDAAGESTVSGVYAATDQSGALIGWGFKVASRGYGGPISMVLGLDRNGKVLGLTIVSMNETPGLGTRVKSDPTFLPQFMSLPDGYTDADVKKLDTISGATKSSRGVRNSVAAAGRIYEQVLAGKEGVR